MTFFKVFRWLLAPLALIYHVITSLRNYMYDKNIFSSTAFGIPTIVVGNLSVGGTGKTPQVAYLIEFLQSLMDIAVLSRGYGRSTKGYIEATENENVNNIGDEPYLYHTRYPNTKVFVSESRVFGIQSILKKYPNTGLVLLDDAFQHRALKASFNIVLTSYDQLFINDFLMPLGRLRESKKGINRAQLIVVTKCPNDLSFERQESIAKQLPFDHQKIFFSTIKYSNKIVCSNHALKIAEIQSKKILLITGIANPSPLTNKMINSGLDFKHLKFSDHHNFSLEEIKNIQQTYREGNYDFILTTEKDYMRLKNELSPLYYWQIETQFLDRETVFKNILIQHIKCFEAKV